MKKPRYSESQIVRIFMANLSKDLSLVSSNRPTHEMLDPH